MHCAAVAAASRARKRLKRSAMARRLLPAFFARSASCHPIMETACEAESLEADAETPLISAASSASLGSLAEAAGAFINVQPAAGAAAAAGGRRGFVLPAIDTAVALKAPISPVAPRWGLSPDCERLLWR